MPYTPAQINVSKFLADVASHLPEDYSRAEYFANVANVAGADSALRIQMAAEGAVGALPPELALHICGFINS